MRRLLFVAAVLAVPLPIVALGPGRVPAGHQLELGLLALAFGAVESAQGVTLVLAATLLLPALAYAALLWLAAWLLARALAKLPSTTRTRAALLVVMLGVAFALAEPIYVTPFSSRSARSSLLGVYW